MVLTLLRTIKSNKLIAGIASLKATEFNATVYTQADIKIEPNICVEYTEEKSNPPSTLQLARSAISWAQGHNIDTLYIAAAKPHLWRCIRDLEYAISEEMARIKVRVCEDIERYSENEWYCSDSLQPRTRSKKEWIRREYVLKWMPMVLYKLVAS